LERFKAIFRNFAAQTPHIRQGLSSEQFLLFRHALKVVMAGLVPAIHASPHGTKNVDARDEPGHDDVEALMPHVEQIRPLSQRTARCAHALTQA
jgi:hypothetical protein